MTTDMRHTRSVVEISRAMHFRYVRRGRLLIVVEDFAMHTRAETCTQRVGRAESAR